MDFASNQFAQSLVDELVPRDRPQTGELRRNDARGEVGVVVGFDNDVRAGQSGANEFGDAFGSDHVGL